MTSRFESTGTTGRWEQASHTGKFGNAAPVFDSLGLKRNELVNRRFRIIEQIMVESGEADIYLCTDELTKKDAVIKFYRYRFTPNEELIEQLKGLRHDDLVSIIDFGKWKDRFYEAMEYCRGGMLLNYLKLDVSAIRSIIPEVLNGIDYLHSSNIIHRDIRPENIYFREPNMKDLVIGDFGISSIIAEDTHTHWSHKHAWSYDYAPPEVYDGKWHKASDYYSLGITLIHAYIGESPFRNYATDQYKMKAHLFGDIPHRDKLPADLRSLVVGLTQIRPENRWGFNQVTHWLKGEQILTKEGRPWQPEPKQAEKKGYPRYPSATNPRELAAALDKFDITDDLYRSNNLKEWVFVHLNNADLADKIKKISEDYLERRSLGIIKLGFLLDPELPLKITGHPVSSLAKLEALLATHDAELRNALKIALFDEHIECWIEETQDIVGDGGKEKLLGIIASIRRKFHQDRDLGLFALACTLSPQTPLVLDQGKNIQITLPEQLEAVISKHPYIIDRITALLFDRYFEEWLRHAFSENKSRLKSADLIESVRSRFSSDRKLATWAVRWHFAPTLGFPFLKTMVKSPKELAIMIDKDKSSWSEGNRLLTNGWIKAWLETTGQIQSSQFEQLDAISGSWERKIEALVALLAPNTPKPKPAASSSKVDLGKISTESEKSAVITINNASRGYLYGSISLLGNGHGITIDNSAIEGKPLNLTITAKAMGLPAGSRQSVNISINTNGGLLEIPVTFTVTAPIWKMIGRSLIAGICVGSILFLARYVLGVVSPKYNQKNIGFHSWDYINNGMSNPFKIGLTSFMVIAIIISIVYYYVAILRAKVK